MAHQVSARGGMLRLRLNGDRVILGGQAVTVWRGEFGMTDGLHTDLSDGPANLRSHMKRF